MKTKTEIRTLEILPVVRLGAAPMDAGRNLRGFIFEKGGSLCGMTM
jgi:hypothetical protein